MEGSQYESLRVAGLASDSATKKQVEAINSLGRVEFEALFKSLQAVKEAMIEVGAGVGDINTTSGFIL